MFILTEDGYTVDVFIPEIRPTHTWRDKVHETISRLCREAYLKANTTKIGRHRKRHVPYAVPSIAQDLVDALGRDDEETCKAIMLWRIDP